MKRDRQLADLEVRRCAARITISEANSIPVAWSARRAEDVTPDGRMPQCASLIGVRKSRFRKPESSGLPIRLSVRHRARFDVLHPVSHHKLGAASSSLMKRGISSKSYVRSASIITM